MEATKAVQVVCALIEDDAGRLLVAQRPPGKHLAGLWEFPGGKIEPGETPEEALVREVTEELGCSARPGAALTPVVHVYEKFTVRLIPFLTRLDEASARPEAREHAALRWVTRAEIGVLPMPAADAPIVAEWVARGGAGAGGASAGGAS
jgi:8-oxo-dGTP diphosphatase